MFFRLRNDIYCVGWGVKLYSLTHCTSFDCKCHTASAAGNLSEKNTGPEKEGVREDEKSLKMQQRQLETKQRTGRKAAKAIAEATTALQ